ncbi:NAD-dependent epimerase/dehydratase family protein [Ramlibacter algicola]|uniref:Uncharacterized protein n=1 Tax=Ramlibacter algicola TaxID=2795217 RepID=A0A934UQM3_9BURK|nr:hypothetical protein [Ramlibacter algicola]MBK0392260.1 hypothetical protein [Ramlibacter algicola]
MNVVMLGGATPAGARLASLLRDSGWARPVLLRPHDPGMEEAFAGADAVVDCSGSPRAALARRVEWMQACLAAKRPRLVVLGSARVYGSLRGRVDEASPWPRTAEAEVRGWRAVEGAARACAAAGGQVVVLRAGPLWGNGLPLVRRLATALRERRLGDLGAHGDGWSNLVPVDDACLAIIRALQLPLQRGDWRCYNLAAPDSPRWNDLFLDLALGIGATPVPRIAAWRIAAEQWIATPLLDALRGMAPRDDSELPQAISRPEAAAWRLQQRVDASAATNELRLDWTPYPSVLADVAAWEVRQHGLERLRRAGVAGHPARRGL